MFDMSLSKEKRITSSEGEGESGRESAKGEGGREEMMMRGNSRAMTATPSTTASRASATPVRASVCKRAAACRATAKRAGHGGLAPVATGARAVSVARDRGALIVVYVHSHSLPRNETPLYNTCGGRSKD